MVFYFLFLQTSYFKDSFNDLSKIELQSALLNSDECEINQIEGIVTLPINKEEDSTIKIKEMPIINSSSIIKKELCYWNSEWDGIEDYNLWLKLRKQNKQFYNCSEILVRHRIHNDSAFNAKGNNNKVDNLLVSHGFTSRTEKKNNPSKINTPNVNKINMKLF